MDKSVFLCGQKQRPYQYNTKYNTKIVQRTEVDFCSTQTQSAVMAFSHIIGITAVAATIIAHNITHKGQKK
jgi:hypothetical protein